MRRPGQPFAHPPLPHDAKAEDLAAFQAWLEQAIPLVGHLGLQSMAWEDDALVWQLRLAPNLNDKGSGFGGSLAAQATLIGWTWTTLWLRARGRRQDVVVAHASQRYLAPVTADYRLICRPQTAQGASDLQASLRERGKGRLALAQQLYVGDTLCFQAEGDYAVLPA
ncbi:MULTISPECIES: YiiD C-terminal domain-containing protein [unclassified Modicisalibacter]|uniref:YiiD C-terminal domain-containing protein n=1 Tax=unclassified Modicisalibacter TaxID=2679913 RepID=UPI001CC9146D|nr:MULTISPECIES: YiiD C-terminal domain-containing protein [unclassified Modicisalibacter]MBZ9557352.1 YiiD C-terminal domain-containing protein [Modicisalibacter sp. R2A 31.J]MBZ9573982.1 YiiD C-terminal domain-containing protein [Modicisalibacter sp. MOD 31.J]